MVESFFKCSRLSSIVFDYYYNVNISISVFFFIRSINEKNVLNKNGFGHVPNKQHYYYMNHYNNNANLNQRFHIIHGRFAFKWEN